MKLIVKYIFLADILFLEGVVLDLDKYIFTCQTCFIWGSSYNGVVSHSGKYGNQVPETQLNVISGKQNL